MANKVKAAAAVCSILIGLLMLLYPWLSESLYQNRVDSIVNTYDVETENLDEEEKKQTLAAARKYNEYLKSSKIVLTDPFTKELETQDGSTLNYDSLLSFDEFGLMGSIEIPRISVYLPIYHGTGADVLERGVGHLENSSLPVGGAGTHAVLSAHTGLNSAKLFTDLTELEKGDQFYIHIMDEILAYEVCDINVVLPQNTKGLNIQPGRDLVTLITCTPYGVNSHRLLVTGERTEYVPQKYDAEAQKSEDAPASQWMRTYRRAILIGLAIVFVLVVIDRIVHRVKRRGR